MDSFMNSRSRTCFPSMAAISDKAKLTEDYTRKRVNELVKYGYVKIIRKGCGRYSNTYLLENITLKKEDHNIEIESFIQEESDVLDVDSKNKVEQLENKTVISEQLDVKDSSDDLVINARGINEYGSEVVKSNRSNLVKSTRSNNNNVTINKEQYSSSIEKEDLLILNLCNDLREKRFGLEALDTDENIQPIRVVLEKFEFKDN